MLGGDHDVYVARTWRQCENRLRAGERHADALVADEKGTARKLFQKRRQRVRSALRAKGGIRPRLSVHRSGRHIYAQVIDDLSGRTLVAASSLDKNLNEGAKSGANKDAAAAVGKLLAERAKAAGVTAVVFDRGGYLFHGRVKALADAAREVGLQF